MMIDQLFGLGNDGRIDLFCRVESIEADGIKFYVINGAWHGLYKSNGTLICYAPSGNHEYLVTCSYFGPVPKFRDQFYNEAIDWMNGEMTNDETKQYCVTKREEQKHADWLAMLDDDIPF